jgi:2'-5' RNA ligase
MARLRRRDDGLRWSSPESWHITLQFLGNTTRDPYECVLARLSEIHISTVPIQLDTLGCFERAGVFFVGVHPSPELTALERHVIAATTLCGFTPETRPYHPHITLARSKGKNGGATLRKLTAGIHTQPRFTSFIAEEFLLYESRPTPNGTRYDVLERFLLRAR